jgi:uracil-DNA glycosylase family 4
VSDAHARLRQYLEQRRELGETEFVLDSLTVEEAMKVLTQKAPPPEVDWRKTVEPPAPTPREPRAPEPRAIAPVAPSATPPVTAPLAEAPLTDLSAARSLADIAAAVAKCTACALSASSLNHVPGEGSPDAKFVVVGEAPGATEDELGRPFVGKSGDLLTKILEAIGLKREDVFICNVLKHRPPGNRNPTPAEIRACSPFLLRQLEVLQPKVILALGTFAAQTLLGTDAAISKLRGIEHRYHGIPLVATYHPAALLRNPNWKRPTWEDVQLARRILDRA